MVFLVFVVYVILLIVIAGYFDYFCILAGFCCDYYWLVCFVFDYLL